jgi:signal transduction histidine kinase
LSRNASFRLLSCGTISIAGLGIEAWLVNGKEIEHPINGIASGQRGDASRWLRLPHARRASPRAGPSRRLLLAAGAVAVLVVAWAGIVLAVPQARFVIYDPRVKTGLEVFLAAVSLFLAVVFFLFPEDDGRLRLRWVSLGFVMLGLGGIGFGYLLPIADGTSQLNTAMFGSLLVRSCAATVLAAGLSLPRPPRLTATRASRLLAAFTMLALGVWLIADRLPRLVAVDSLDSIVDRGPTILPGLTAWHWSLSVIPIIAAIAAAAGSVVTYPGRAPEGWLTVALVLMAGSQLHTYLWPTAYSSILTTASILRIAFTVVIAMGGFLELRRVAAERATLLATERAAAARQAELARLRADFSAMVVHELASPLAAVRRSADLLAADSLTTAQAHAVQTIERQVGLLDALVADAQAGADAGRDDFDVFPSAVPLGLLLADAVDYAETLPGEHQVTCGDVPQAVVRADPERMAQVLHNLLGNAAKYAPAGTPILLLAERADGHIRITVEDRGPGVAPGDVPHIFEMYARGTHGDHRVIPGKGLGLFLSRRIVQAHGSDLHVADSTNGHGARFWFELEVAG